MILSLIGMSSAGKTHWAKRIERAGFERFSCDDVIEELLHSELGDKGFVGLSDVAEWMGHPYEKRYHVTSKKYLEAEELAMNTILDTVESKINGLIPNIVVDTTGSAIYTSQQVLSRLKNLTKVIYLEIPDEQKGKMAKEFILDPKPLIWGDVFSLEPHEDPKKGLIRSYPKLLEFRSKKYEELADFTFKFEDHKSTTLDVNGFFQYISHS